MAIIKRINSKAKTDENTGFGSNSNMYGGRFINKDGTPDIRKVGIPFLERISWFHSMLQMKQWKFFTLIFLFYGVMNFLFAVIYILIGIQNLSGVTASTPLTKFYEAFFFSAQSLTTVGYGRLAPTGFAMSLVASIEALLGLMSFAVVTGLLYGRFSRPQAYLKFSQNALVAPYKETIAVMFRMAPYKNNRLTDAEVKVTLAMMEEVDGKMMNKFYPIKLEMDKINALSLSWTIVHPVDENSPFYGLSKDDLIAARGEIMVFVKAFDDTFSNTVVTRSSYLAKELIFGAKFLPMFRRDDSNGGTTVMEIDKLNMFEKVDVSFSDMMRCNETQKQESDYSISSLKENAK